MYINGHQSEGTPAYEEALFFPYPATWKHQQENAYVRASKSAAIEFLISFSTFTDIAEDIEFAFSRDLDELRYIALD